MINVNVNVFSKAIVLIAFKLVENSIDPKYIFISRLTLKKKRFAFQIYIYEYGI